MAPDWEKAEALVRAVAAGPTGVVFWTCVLLAVAGAVRVRRVARVAVPLLVLPPALLMTASQVQPLYHERYVLYAFAGAPLLVAAGGEWLAAGALSRLLPDRRVPDLPHARGHLSAATPVVPRNDRRQADGWRRLPGARPSLYGWLLGRGDGGTGGGGRASTAVLGERGRSEGDPVSGVLLADHRDPQPDHPRH
ncbi:hypothetical protein GRC12_45065, partial [Streptomyces griseorubiginosus]|nr:hypothetical protein [Streptomyces griseorubiginosus]